ncbi:MAG: two-component regulator propeller domain-containing protein [Acidobacteriota bacterium]
MGNGRRSRRIFTGIHIFLVLVLFSTLSWGLDNSRPIHQNMKTIWTAKQGLPSDNITDLIQDKRGYIWIGTFNGLVRFDGINFKVFSSNDNSGFISNSATVIMEGKDGTLWIGTNGDGIARYKDHKFTGYTYKNGLPDNVVQSLCEDDRGNILVGTRNGLGIIGKNGTISTPYNKNLKNESIQMIYKDFKKKIWIATGTGKVFLLEQKGIFRKEEFDLPKNNVVLSIFNDSGKNFLIGTRDAGLFRLRKGKLEKFGENDGITARTINSLTRGSRGCIWISTDTGVFRYNNGKVATFDEKTGLSDNQVTKIVEDKEGSIWISTSRGGLNKISEGKFSTITIDQGLIYNKVNSVMEEKKDTFWIGTDRGLSVYENNKFINNPLIKKLKDSRIRHIMSDSTGRIWISTYGNLGVVSYFRGNIRSYTAENGLTGNRCRVSVEDSSGNIWIGTSNGLNRIQNGAITRFTKRDGLGDNYILSLFEDSKNVLWITTNGGGVSYHNNNKFITLNEGHGLCSNIVFRTMEDSDGNLWFSTNKGISRYNRKNFVNYTDKDGLSGKAVFQIIEDIRGKFWMTADVGVFTANKKALNDFAEEKTKFVKTTLYNDMDGLLDSSTPLSWGARSSDNRIWFPTLKGIAIIDTLNIPMNENPPPLLIEKIFIDSKSFLPGEITTLKPDYKRIVFKYTALSYVIPHKVQYKFKLDGFETEWSTLTIKREASYTTLPPGRYVFKVRAVNNDGIWNKDPVQIQFEQKPFFYQTIWFTLLIILSLMGLIAFFLGMRIKNLRNREKELEYLVRERTAELEATDRIVANINKEIDFSKLLRVLLNQTLTLFPQAEKGAVLILNTSRNTFETAASKGYEKSDIASLSLTWDEAVNRYTKGGEEPEPGIFILKNFAGLPGEKSLSSFTMPKSLLAMTISSGNTIEGFFVLVNMKDKDAFSSYDATKLNRIKAHAVTAVFKARTHQKLEEAAIKDPLTRLNNRRKMLTIIESEAVRFQRTGKAFCIVMGDIDYFKVFNDHHGHDCGDFVLKEVSTLIRSTIRKQDVVGRWGGEEFLLVYPETDINGGEIVSEKVRRSIEEKIFEFKEVKLKITITFGLAEYKKNKTIDSCIKDADDALYKGKQKGRNCVVINKN